MFLSFFPQVDLAVLGMKSREPVHTTHYIYIELNNKSFIWFIDKYLLYLLFLSRTVAVNIIAPLFCYLIIITADVIT